MKICDLCGHANFKFEVVDKKPICHCCGKPMSTTPQCKPTRNNDIRGTRQGETSRLYDDVTIKEQS